MTKSTETERAELAALADVLESRGRNNSPHDIQRAASALRSFAQEQKPVAWQWFYGDSWYTVTKRDVSNPEKYCRSQSDIVRPIYAAPQKPPPAAGWDEAIETAISVAKQSGAKVHPRVEALRHNAPPDTPAGKSAPLEPRGCPTPGACSCPSVTPDHGGADEGVRDLLSLVLDELLQHNKEYSHVTKPEVFDKIEKALSHQPAPVAANASAEARLREALEQAEQSFEAIRKTLIKALNEPERTAFWQAVGGRNAVHEALSAHPHAGDCDKQGETMKSEGGSRKQPFDPADAAGVKSGTVTFDGQTGRPNRDEVGASQTPGSSMSFAADKPIIAGQAPGPSDRTADVKCEACSGTGRHMGRFSMNDPDCTYCNGKGKVLAGDCDKQGDAPKAEFITGYFTDQYKAGAKPPVGPSDRAADVTVEDIALVLLDGLKAGKAPIQIARDVRRAFTVGMR